MEASDFGPVPMNQYQSLRYSLGFLLGESHERVAGHFRRIDFPRPLATHPRTRIAVAESLAGPLAILGQVVHPDLPHLDLDGIARLLAGTGVIMLTGIGEMLNDNELAAVLSYIRQSFGNDGELVSAEAVRRVRAATRDRINFYTTEELLKEHPLKSGPTPDATADTR